MRSLIWTTAPVILAAALSACGGGGSGGIAIPATSTSGTTAPAAVADAAAATPATSTASTTPSTPGTSTTPPTNTPTTPVVDPEPMDPETPIAPNSIQLQSDAGDFVGAGKNYEYTRANAIIGLVVTGNRLSFRVTGDQTWNGDFILPNSISQVQTGTYSNLLRYPFNNPVTGGLDWFGDGRGCNVLSGSFTISSVTYVSGILKAVELSFEQHCEGGGPALRGQIHWTAYDKSVAPGPVNPPPAGLWQPMAGTTPSAGNYVYLASDAGDYIGQGASSLYTLTTDPATVTASGGQLSVSVAGWSGTFVTMNSIDRLKPGYYGGLNRYPFHNPATGGLSWSGNGRGCNTLRGYFVVDAVTYLGTALQAIDLRFEQHCEGLTPALRGKVHWVAPT